MSLLRDNTTPAPRVESHLSELRKRRGIAAAELARAAGIGRQTMYVHSRRVSVCPKPPFSVVETHLGRSLRSAILGGQLGFANAGIRMCPPGSVVL